MDKGMGFIMRKGNKKKKPIYESLSPLLHVIEKQLL